MLCANRLNANPVAVFVSYGSKDKIALRAAEVIGAQGSVIDRERLFRRNLLRAGGVSPCDPFIAPNVIVRVDGPFATTFPLQKLVINLLRYAPRRRVIAKCSITSGSPVACDYTSPSRERDLRFRITDSYPQRRCCRSSITAVGLYQV